MVAGGALQPDRVGGEGTGRPRRLGRGAPGDGVRGGGRIVEEVFLEEWRRTLAPLARALRGVELAEDAAAYGRALELATQPADRTFLERRLAEVRSRT
jgi:predicted RNA polymerase sigma factor